MVKLSIQEWLTMQAMVIEGFETLKDVLGGADADSTADLSLLQRLAKTAAEPLKRLGTSSPHRMLSCQADVQGAKSNCD